MKFRTDIDAQAFHLEIDLFEGITSVTKDFSPSEDQLEAFIKSRGGYVSKHKDIEKSKAQKKNWRKNKHKIKKGIKAFHRSTDGKKFHRKLGRFLATRITRDRKKDESFVARGESLKALTSAKQQLYIELDYFHPIEEQRQLEEFIIDYAIPMFSGIESKIAMDEELELNELDFLLEIISESSLQLELADSTNLPVAKIAEVWNSITCHLNNEECNVEKLTEEFDILIRTLDAKTVTS